MRAVTSIDQSRAPRTHAASLPHALLRLSRRTVAASLAELPDVIIDALRLSLDPQSIDRALAQIATLGDPGFEAHLPSAAANAPGVAAASAWLDAHEGRGRRVVLGSLDELPADAGALKTAMRDARIGALVAIPLRLEDGPILGRVTFFTSRPRAWASDELEQLTLVSENVAMAFARVHEQSALAELVHFETLLARVASRFVAFDSDAIDDELRHGLFTIGSERHLDALFVAQVDEHGRALGVTHAFEPASASSRDRLLTGPIASLAPIVQHALRGHTLGGRVEIAPLGSDAHAFLHEAAAHAFALVPIRIEGRVRGLLAAFTDQHQRAEAAGAPLARLQVVADLIGALLARGAARAQTELRERRVERERDYLREERHHCGIVGSSPALRHAIDLVDAVAQTTSSVLLLGESGVGKELFASAVHERSARCDAPFVRVNCASIPATLFESEFFGHARGSFTGAVRDRAGRFELADGGTLFLDEIGEVPLELQAKLLRVLQEGETERIGEERTRRLDVRIVAASNRDLAGEVEAGRFRRDLYYRLSVFPIEIPPLRARGEDVILLARHFLLLHRASLGRPSLSLSCEDEARLRTYDWPGNVRELEHVLERAVILSRSPPLRLDLALPIRGAPIGPTPSGELLRDEDVRRLERDNLLRALDLAGGRVSGTGGAADLLGVNPSTLRDRMKAARILRRE